MHIYITKNSTVTNILKKDIEGDLFWWNKITKQFKRTELTFNSITMLYTKVKEIANEQAFLELL
jgi:hypothetical protein